MFTRRGFLVVLSGIIAAPLVVNPFNIMPVRALILPPKRVWYLVGGNGIIRSNQDGLSMETAFSRIADLVKVMRPGDVVHLGKMQLPIPVITVKNINYEIGDDCFWGGNGDAGFIYQHPSSQGGTEHAPLPVAQSVELQSSGARSVGGPCLGLDGRQLLLQPSTGDHEAEGHEPDPPIHQHVNEGRL